MTLNVTALIDICSMIIIFLVMGTYFGESSVVIPTDMQVPKSVSKESLDNAPRVMISAANVSSSFMAKPISLNLFHGDVAASPEMESYKQQLQAFVAAIPAEARRSGVLLNVIADQATPYRDIFDVISVFRAAGFQSMLFIAQGK